MIENVKFLTGIQECHLQCRAAKVAWKSESIKDLHYRERVWVAKTNWDNILHHKNKKDAVGCSPWPSKLTIVTVMSGYASTGLETQVYILGFQTQAKQNEYHCSGVLLNSCTDRIKSMLEMQITRSYPRPTGSQATVQHDCLVIHVKVQWYI